MRLKQLLIMFLLGSIGMVFLVLFLAINSKPLIHEGETLNAEDVERIKQQWEEHDPRQMLPGKIKHLLVTERDLNLFFTYASSHALGNRLKARAELYQGAVYFWSTTELPFRLFGPYLNVSGMISQHAGVLKLTELRIGALSIPSWANGLLLHFGSQRVQRSADYQRYADILQAVKDFQFQQGRLLLVYKWQPDMIVQIQSQGKELLLTDDDKERLRIYNKQFVNISKQLHNPSSLVTLLKPLFRFARQRTETGEDPIEENRIILLTLALYANKQPIRDFIGSDDTAAYPHVTYVDVILLRRHDLAQHFLISAAITASADSGVAEALGVFKELDDSQGGSGFSFEDLAADRAGLQFAELLTKGSSRNAKQGQQRLSKVKSETEFMPSVDNLPEGIMALELKQRYGDLDSASYQMLNAEIDRRIATCWLYLF